MEFRGGGPARDDGMGLIGILPIGFASSRWLGAVRTCRRQIMRDHLLLGGAKCRVFQIAVLTAQRLYRWRSE
jgi:hypothetical protein